MVVAGEGRGYGDVVVGFRQRVVLCRPSVTGCDEQGSRRGGDEVDPAHAGSVAKKGWVCVIWQRKAGHNQIDMDISSTTYRPNVDRLDEIKTCIAQPRVFPGCLLHLSSCTRGQARSIWCRGKRRIASRRRRRVDVLGRFFLSLFSQARVRRLFFVWILLRYREPRIRICVQEVSAEKMPTDCPLPTPMAQSQLRSGISQST